MEESQLWRAGGGVPKPSNRSEREEIGDLRPETRFREQLGSGQAWWGGTGWMQACSPAMQVPLPPPGPCPLGSWCFVPEKGVGKGFNLSKPQV